MPTFDELRQRYMVTDSASIPCYSGCSVTAHIGGGSYFADLKSAIDALSGEGAFIYLTGWWFQPDFSLDSATGGSPSVDLLKSKAHSGVDVRVLGWILCPTILQHPSMTALRLLLRAPIPVQSLGQARDFLAQHDQTMNTMLALRAEPALADKAVLNTLSFPAGAVHEKLAILGNNSQAFFFTGGIDHVMDRWLPKWHDVQAKVTGPVVQDVYNAYRDMWNEIRSRPPVQLTALEVTCDNRTPGMPEIPARTLNSTTGSRLHVQSFKTLPRFSCSSGLPCNDPLSYAPSGLFDVQQGWQKAVSGAESYIYIEDQALTSTDVFQWINTRIKACADLRVLLVRGAPDPRDPPLRKLSQYAISNYLLKNLTQNQCDQIGLFEQRGKVVHSKTTIVDDRWALIGSANCMRRSLYTDFEQSVGFMDEDEHRVIRAYRMDLWRTSVNGTDGDVAEALDTWFAIPYASDLVDGGAGSSTGGGGSGGSGGAGSSSGSEGSAGAEGSGPSEDGSGSGGGAGSSGGASSSLTGVNNVVRIRLPGPQEPRVQLSASEIAIANELLDADSRNTWGSTLMSSLLTTNPQSLLQGLGSQSN